MSNKIKERGALSGYLLLLLVFALVLSLRADVFAEETAKSWTITKVWEKFKNGPPADPKFFPIIVWLQAPANAAKYKAAGINTYMGLYKGPKAGDIKTLRDAGMRLICEMNAEALKNKGDKTIIGWMMVDEPDNWQFKTPILMNGKTWNYGPKASRISEKDMLDMYNTVRSGDSTRPVLLGFSCGIANDNYGGRGGGWKNTMYPGYMKACDWVGFDIYPTASVGDDALWYHGKGLDRIKEWAGVEKPRFNAIGPCYTGKKRKPRPEEVKTEIWLSIIHGSNGIVYFAHNISPFVEDALLKDPMQLENITKINAQITELAPVINGPEYKGASVASSNDSVPIDLMAKKYNGETYIFSVAARMGDETTGAFQVQGVSKAGKVQVLGEDRILDIDESGKFKDEFKRWEVHIYRVIKN